MNAANVTMKKNHAIAYVRQLCCLGLGKETVLEEFLHAVRTIIASESNLFLWMTEDFFPNYVIYQNILPDVADIFLTESERLYGPIQGAVAGWYRHNRVLDDVNILSGQFYKTDFYHLCWRPYGQHHILQGLVKQGSSPGLICIFRSKSQRPFSATEKALFGSLLPYVEHALNAGSYPVMDYAGSGESGLFIVDSECRLIFASETARLLLSLARYPAYPVGQGNVVRDLAIPPAVERLCRNLNGIFRGREVPPPSLTHDNPRGRFLFRAHWLDPLNREPGSLIGVTVEHQEPMALQLLRGIKTLPLSPVQMEVCLLLAQNHSQDSIAQRLHIKPTTAKDHIRKIYLKLDIHQRDELVGCLTAKTEIPR